MRNIIPLTAFLCIFACVSCTSTEKSKELDIARHMGRTQAIELSELLAPDTISMEKMLIDVRTRETALRTHGHTEIADVYIETFLTTLDSVNPSLAGELRR